MKFMQRKEEAKRRALFEAEQREEVESRLGDTTSHRLPSHHPVSSGPTILVGSSFPRQSYALSYRSFCAKEEGQPTVGDLHPPEAAQEGAEEDAQQADHWLNDVTCVNGDGLDVGHDPTIPVDPSLVSSKSSKQTEQLSEATSLPPADGERRFYPQGAIRAPKLPKRLAHDVQIQQPMSKRRRVEEKEGDD